MFKTNFNENKSVSTGNTEPLENSKKNYSSNKFLRNPIENHVLPRFLVHPPDISISAPQNNFSVSELGRVVFPFLNASVSFTILFLLLKILMYKEIIVYEHNVFILGSEILICLFIFIFNIKEGLKK